MGPSLGSARARPEARLYFEGSGSTFWDGPRLGPGPGSRSKPAGTRRALKGPILSFFHHFLSKFDHYAKIEIMFFPLNSPLKVKSFLIGLDCSEFRPMAKVLTILEIQMTMDTGHLQLCNNCCVTMCSMTTTIVNTLPPKRRGESHQNKVLHRLFLKLNFMVWL